MSTRSHDTDRSDMNSLKSPTLLTSSEQPLAQLSESESDDVHTQYINLQRACRQANCDSEFRRLASICTSATDAEYNSDNLSDTGQLFKKTQENVPTLKHWRNLAELGSKTFVLQNRVLWKRPDPQVLSENTLLLCVPQNYRQQVMEASHDSLHSGCHMAFRRTLTKLISAFAFSTDFSIVKAYCRSCETCARKRPLHKKTRSNSTLYQS